MERGFASAILIKGPPVSRSPLRMIDERPRAARAGVTSGWEINNNIGKNAFKIFDIIMVGVL